MAAVKMAAFFIVPICACQTFEFVIRALGSCADSKKLFGGDGVIAK
jgi:hypothetical protein